MIDFDYGFGFVYARLGAFSGASLVRVKNSINFAVVFVLGEPAVGAELVRGGVFLVYGLDFAQMPARAESGVVVADSDFG